MKPLVLPILLLFLAGCVQANVSGSFGSGKPNVSAGVEIPIAFGDDFCGYSTYGSCDSDFDCIKAGCSGEVCASQYEEPIFTTCEWRECSDAEKYNLRCKCIRGKCQWGN